MSDTRLTSNTYMKGSPPTIISDVAWRRTTLFEQLLHLTNVSYGRIMKDQRLSIDNPIESQGYLWPVHRCDLSLQLNYP